MKTVIIIPAYQEGQVIGSVIRELRKYGYIHIIVIDDGSEDDTYIQAQKAGAIVLRHALNRGKGASIKTGIAAAKRLHADAVVTFDGDGQHDPKDIKILLGYIRKGYDVVLGTRFMNRQNIPQVKRMYNGIANFMTLILYGIWVTDSQSGLRAYSKHAFTALDTRSDRYEFDTEVLREIHKRHLRYKEIPIHVRYTAYSQSKEAKQNTQSGIKTALRLLLRA